MKSLILATATSMTPLSLCAFELSLHSWIRGVGHSGVIYTAVPTTLSNNEFEAIYEKALTCESGAQMNCFFVVFYEKSRGRKSRDMVPLKKLKIRSSGGQCASRSLPPTAETSGGKILQHGRGGSSETVQRWADDAAAATAAAAAISAGGGGAAVWGGVSLRYCTVGQRSRRGEKSLPFCHTSPPGEKNIFLLEYCCQTVANFPSCFNFLKWIEHKKIFINQKLEWLLLVQYILYNTECKHYFYFTMDIFCVGELFF
jgi:hypothetical protein